MKKENSKEGLPAGCGGLTSNVQDNGAPLDPAAAKGYITNYLTGIKDPGATNHNYGYLFGLDKVAEFMNRIAQYNAGTPVKQIEGVRVYLGRKEPTAGASPMEKIMDTLFLIPVYTDGTDLPTVHLADGATNILGDPRPCPTLCFNLSFASE